MTNPPRPPSGSSGWVDPEAPTGVAPQQQRPQPHPWPAIPASSPPLAAPPQRRTPPWPSPPGPWPQQPSPSQQAPTWTGGSGPGLPYGALQNPPAQLPPKNRKPLILGLVAAVGAVAVVIGFVSFSGGSSSEATAGETVKAYLQALSTGDAAKALSYGRAQPASTELLTDAILNEQLAKAPISNIRILDEDKTIGATATAKVHVAVNFGQTVNDATLTLTTNDDDKAWKLASAVVKIDPPFTSLRDLGSQSVTVFGKDFKNGPLYTFPGFQDLGSTNRYVKVIAEPILLDRLQTLYTAASLLPQLTLNDNGHRAIQDQLANAFTKCQGSMLAPPGCPAQLLFSDGVDGTANWGPADLSGVLIGDVTSFDMTALVSGVVMIPLTYRTATGELKDGTATAYMASSADITKTPPKLDLR